MIEPGILYKAHVINIEENRCYVSLDDDPYDEGWARIIFPFYHVEELDGSDIRYGHGIVYKPEKGAECVVTTIGSDMVITGFLSPINDKISLKDPSVVDGVENLDSSLKTASELIEEYKKMEVVNKDQENPRKESYYHNDDQKTFGDIGLVSPARNKIFCFSFGLNLIQATDYCFRFYSKLKHTVKEAFWNFYRYTPNGKTEWTNSKDNGSNYKQTMKYNYADTQPIFTEIIGQQADGHMIRHNAHEESGDGEIVETIDLEGNQQIIHSDGESICVESIGTSVDGRSIKARNQSVSGTISADFSSTLATTLTGKITIISNGVANTVQGVMTTIKGKAQVHINPPQAKKTKDSPATGTTKDMGGKMKAAEAIGKVQEYAPQAAKTVSQVRAGKVQEAMISTAAVYGPKVLDKVGGAAPNVSGIKAGALSKVSSVVDKVASKFPEGMRDKIKEAATKQIIKHATQQFQNLVVNNISRATGDIISAQSVNTIMGIVASSGSETYDKDNIEFKKDDMDQLMEDDVGPATNDIIKDATFNPAPEYPALSEIDNNISNNITWETVKPLIEEQQHSNAWAVEGARGM